MSDAISTPASKPLASSNTWRLISLILIIAALGISGYLAYTELVEGSVTCIASPGFDCDLVQSSTYSKVLGIPVAYLGLAANLVIFLILLLEPRIPFLKANGIPLLFGILLFALLFSGWLIYVQAALLKSFCMWCLSHEVVVLLLFIAGAVRLGHWMQLEGDLD